MYSELNELIEKQVAYSIFKIGGLQEFVMPSVNLSNITVSAPAKTMDNNNSSSETSQVYIERKVKDSEGNEVGRNDQCPCGSGKKYKKCGLLDTPEHQANMAKK